MGPKKIGNNFRKSINPLTIIHVLTRLSSRTVPSREVPGSPGKVPGRDKTGPRDPEGPGTKKSLD